MLRWLGVLVVVIGLVVGGLFVAAGRSAPPALSIDKPDRSVGQRGDLEISASAPGARFTALTISVEQDGRTIPLFALDAPQSSTVAQPSGDQLHVVRPFGKVGVPDLRQGPARIVVSATRKSFLNLRERSSRVTKDIEVRLEPPRIAVVSTHHYVNHGGSELVVYRATPADAISGVRVGSVEYPGFATSGDPAAKVAVFALLHDQDLGTPIVAFARDAAGNEATAPFVDDVFEKPFRKSRIEVDDRFLGRVVPEILAHSPELEIAAPPDDLLPAFLTINGDLRRRNAERIASMTAATAATKLWSGPFVQLGNSKVEASFADHRTYMYKGRDVDHQVHLGFDLAVTSAVPVVAANDGVVVSASWLGIYGNCVIVDHGLGVASLYGHLSSLDVKTGDRIAKGQVIGRSGMTGLAGGDHLHFTMLVGGHPVNPVEWWDAHWMEDRVDRKLRDEAAGPPAAAAR